MKHLVLAGVYVGAIAFFGCEIFTAGARATGDAALALGYYGVAEHALKIATARSPHDFEGRMLLAQAEALAGDDVDAFGPTG